MSEILITKKSKDYELLDSGNGEKLERFGDIVLRRPEGQAIWAKTLSEKEWQNATAVYESGQKAGSWKKKRDIPEDWIVELEGVSFELRMTTSKQVGVFPEQSNHWAWLSKKIKEEYLGDRQKISVLNLFGYTGGASLVCAKSASSATAEMDITQVDGSEYAVNWADKNSELNELSTKNFRFIVEDVRKFVEREIRRGKKYDLILLDPPVYGKGSKKEIWKIEKDLTGLVSRLPKILSENPIAVVLNGYAGGYFSETYVNVLNGALAGLNGKVTGGELALEESSSGRLLTAGIWSRWEK